MVQSTTTPRDTLGFEGREKRVESRKADSHLLMKRCVDRALASPRQVGDDLSPSILHANCGDRDGKRWKNENAISDPFGTI